MKNQLQIWICPAHGEVVNVSHDDAFGPDGDIHFVTHCCERMCFHEVIPKVVDGMICYKEISLPDKPVGATKGKKTA